MSEWISVENLPSSTCLAIVCDQKQPVFPLRAFFDAKLKQFTCCEKPEDFEITHYLIIPPKPELEE